MIQYLDLLQRVLDEGVKKEDRTGTGTISIFGHQSRYKMSDGFPVLTTKKLHLKSIIHELLWFLNGDTNIKYLNDHGVRIWDEWADEQGDLGHIYGYQWRSWPDYSGGNIDQITQTVDAIKNNPDSRRIIVSSWNVADLHNMNLPPCHAVLLFLSNYKNHNPTKDHGNKESCCFLHIKLKLRLLSNNSLNIQFILRHTTIYHPKLSKIINPTLCSFTDITK